VLFVTPWYPQPTDPAAGVFVREQALAAARLVDVAVIHLLPALPGQRSLVALEQLTDAPLPTIRVRYSRQRRLELVLQPIGLRRAIQALRKQGFVPDLIHAHTAVSAIPAAAYCRVAGLPLIVTEHQTVYLDADPSHFTRRALAGIRWALHRAEIVLPVGSTLEAAMRRVAPRARYETVPNVVDCALFHPADERPPTDIITLVAVGLLSEQKDYPTLLTAVRRLLDRGIEVQLDIIGYGSLREELLEIIASLGLSGNVRLLGYLPKPAIADRLRHAHVFVHAGAYEAFCVVAAEALASGLPVVSTRVGGPDDYLTPQTGRLVPPGDPDSMADAIVAVLARLETFDPAAIAAYARERFSTEAVGRRLADVYVSVHRRDRSPRVTAARAR
jgi:glycosyltransferase involved in cell wall biosynthesis